MIKYIKEHLKLILSAALVVILLAGILLIPGNDSIQAEAAYTADKSNALIIATAPPISSAAPETAAPTETPTPTPTETPFVPTPTPTKRPTPTRTPAPTPAPTRKYGTAPYLMQSFLNPEGLTIRTRFTVPNGFVRIDYEEGSFGEYVRNLPLFPYGFKAKEYADDEVTMVVSKDAQNAAVINRDVDIYEQCADSCMRTWAEYLYLNGRYDEISFKNASGGDMSFAQWRQSNGSSHQSLKDFLHYCYQYAYTGSLVQYLTPVKLSDMRIGDIFVKGKTASSAYGHAVMVADMAVNPTTGEVIFMLIQGSTPAVHNHVVLNPDSKYGSPWFPLNFGSSFYSSDEWTFSSKQLKRF